jgi:hypothetical protein
MRHYIYFLTLFIGFNSWAQFGSLSGQFCFGSTEDEFPIKEEQLGNGNRILLLTSNSPAFGDKTENSRGDYDFWVLCLDANDQIVWQRTIGGNAADYPSNLLISADQSIYVCGQTASPQSFEQTNALFGSFDAWLLKMNSAGDILWDNNYGGTASDNFNDLIELPSGNLLIFGTSESGVSGNKTSINYGAKDLWSLKLNADGAILNDKSIGGSAADQIPYAILTAPNRIKLVANSNSAISGLKSEPSFGLTDIWVLDLDTNCNIIQQKTIGGSDNDKPTDLLWSNEGKLLLLAESWSNVSGLKTEDAYGFMDTWILKLADNLDIIQQKTIGGDIYDYGGQLIEWPNGNLGVLTNSNSNPNQFKSAPVMGAFDIWMYALDANFNFLGDKTLGTSQDEIGLSLQLSPNLSDIRVLAASKGGITNDKTCSCKGKYDFWGFSLSSTLQTNNIPSTRSLKLYPNPTSNFITIENNNAEQFLSIDLLDYAGKHIKSFNPKSTSLSLAGFSPGIYLLQISTEKGNFCERIRLE